MAITKGYVDTPDGHIHYRRGAGGSGLPGQERGGVRPRAQHVAVVSRISDRGWRMVRDVAIAHVEWAGGGAAHVCRARHCLAVCEFLLGSGALRDCP